MHLAAISGRLSKIGKNLFTIKKYSTLEKPLLRKPRNYNLVGNKFKTEEDSDKRIDGFGWISLAIPIATFFLGTWQVQRRKWKLQLISDIHERMTSPPVELPENLAKIEEMEYYPVKVRGEYLYEKEFKLGPKSLIKDGVPVGEKSGGLLSTASSTGYWIITPFKVENSDLVILINRGWVKAKRGKLTEDELAHVPGTIEITGIVRLGEERPLFMPKNKPQSGVWVYRDMKSMCKYTGSAPIFLDLVANGETANGPIPGQTRMTLRNEHLTYIITWYSLSLLTAWMWHRLYILKLPLL